MNTSDQTIIFPIRINRYLALAGYASRREADQLIAKGIVTINGVKAKLGDKVMENDRIEVDDEVKKLIKSYHYFAYYKPVGIVSHSPEAGQKAIVESAGLGKDYFPVGRLDRNSHGLIILTNDGRVTERLLHPDNDHEKEYVVTVDKPLTQMFLGVLKKGMDLKDFVAKPAKVWETNENTFRIVLSEGKRHQIRRMCDQFSYTIRDLRRVRVMNIRLGKMKPNQKREIVGRELREFLGLLGLEE